MNKTKIGLAVAAAGIGLALAGGTAHASPETDSKLLKAERALCSLIDSAPYSGTFDMAIQIAVANGVSKKMAGYLLDSAVNAVCPQHITIYTTWMAK